MRRRAKPIKFGSRLAAAKRLVSARDAAKAAQILSRRSTAPPATRGFGFPFRVGEKKFSDTSVQYNLNSTGTVQLLCAPTLGTDYTNRIGRKIFINSVYIRGYATLESPAIAPTTDTATPTHLVRFILFVDMQPNGAAPAVTDVLTSASSVAHLNANNRDRFKVLWDKQATMGPMAVVGATGVSLIDKASFPIKKFKKVRQEVIFNAGNAGTIADINTGALYLLSIANIAAGVGTDSIAAITTRVRFSDP